MRLHICNKSSIWQQINSCVRVVVTPIIESLYLCLMTVTSSLIWLALAMYQCFSTYPPFFSMSDVFFPSLFSSPHLYSLHPLCSAVQFSSLASLALLFAFPTLYLFSEVSWKSSFLLWPLKANISNVTGNVSLPRNIPKKASDIKTRLSLFLFGVLYLERTEITTLPSFVISKIAPLLLCFSLHNNSAFWSWWQVFLFFQEAIAK